MKAEKIYVASDFVMNKCGGYMFEDGDIITFRNGDQAVYIKKFGTFVCQEYGWNDLIDYDPKTLKDPLCPDDEGLAEYDIMKVERPLYKWGCHFGARTDESRELMFERTEEEVEDNGGIFKEKDELLTADEARGIIKSESSLIKRLNRIIAEAASKGLKTTSFELNNIDEVEEVIELLKGNGYEARYSDILGRFIINWADD